jgi:hypothetical protein
MKSKLRWGIPAAVLLLIAAAIAIPSWLRSRMQPGEAPPISDARSMLSAQATYASANGGFYDEPECLLTPARCIPHYDGPPFLGSSLASLQTRHGYVRRFHRGPSPTAEEIAKARASPSSVKTFAYVLVPARFGQTGVRAFCVDGEGRLCFTTDGAMPEITDGRCPESCSPLQ